MNNGVNTKMGKPTDSAKLSYWEITESSLINGHLHKAKIDSLNIGNNGAAGAVYEAPGSGFKILT